MLQVKSPSFSKSRHFTRSAITLAVLIGLRRIWSRNDRRVIARLGFASEANVSNVGKTFSNENQKPEPKSAENANPPSAVSFDRRADIQHYFLVLAPRLQLPVVVCQDFRGPEKPGGPHFSDFSKMRFFFEKPQFFQKYQNLRSGASTCDQNTHSPKSD